jgi:hypothetical protein
MGSTRSEDKQDILVWYGGRTQNKLNFKIKNLVHVHVEEYLNNLVQLISKYTCIFFLK